MKNLKFYSKRVREKESIEYFKFHIHRVEMPNEKIFEFTAAVHRFHYYKRLLLSSMKRKEIKTGERSPEKERRKFRKRKTWKQKTFVNFLRLFPPLVLLLWEATRLKRKHWFSNSNWLKWIRQRKNLIFFLLESREIY